MQVQQFLNEIFTNAGHGNFTNFPNNASSCRQIIMKFLEGLDVPVAKKINFGVDADCNPDPGIFITAGYVQLYKFSAVLHN